MNVLATVAATTDTEPAKVRRNWLPAILTAAFWIGDDPTPEYSNLDRANGLPFGRA